MLRTWLLIGVPRSGTSLCCRLAGDLPDTVALSEPIGRKAFGGMDTRGACARIGDFAEQARARIQAERRVPSIQVEGRLDDNRTASRHTEAGLRRLRGERGEIAIGKPLSARFTLLIKHNALFAALLPRLTESFSCLALVRNPLSVLASWQTVDLPVHRGRIPAGEERDRDLYRTLEQEPEGAAAADHCPQLVLRSLRGSSSSKEHRPLRDLGRERWSGVFLQAGPRPGPACGLEEPEQ